MSTLIVVWVDLNPIDDLRDLVADGAKSAWQLGMFSLWESGLWLLQTAFGLLDEFVTPDLSDPGLTGIYQLCVWLSAGVATLLGMGQLAVAAWRREGAGLGRLAVGVVQYGAALACWVAVGAGVIAASGELAGGILEATLNVESFSGFAAGAGLPTKVTTATGATVLGLLSVLLLIPAAVGFVVVMLVREAALLILVVTLPIAAAGALGETTRAWLWKTVRWFLATCLMAPLMALVLGIGVHLTRAAFPDASTPDASRRFTSTGLSPELGAQASWAAQSDSRSAIGMAVVGCVVLVIACFCPLVLFRLLAFVDPSTGSGAALRASLASANGMSDLLGRSRSDGGSAGGAAGASGGRAAPEATAEGMTQTRFAGATGVLGATGAAAGVTLMAMGRVAQAGAQVSGDVLGASGIGAPSYGNDGHPVSRGRGQASSPRPSTQDPMSGSEPEWKDDDARGSGRPGDAGSAAGTGEGPEASYGADVEGVTPNHKSRQVAGPAPSASGIGAARKGTPAGPGSVGEVAAL